MLRAREPQSQMPGKRGENLAADAARPPYGLLPMGSSIYLCGSRRTRPQDPPNLSWTDPGGSIINIPTRHEHRITVVVDLPQVCAF
jgi:hypothetical protein